MASLRATLSIHLLLQLMIFISIFILALAPPSSSSTTSFSSSSTTTTTSSSSSSSSSFHHSFHASSITTSNDTNSIGFTLPLIDVINSPDSLFYNPNHTRLDRIKEQLRLSDFRYQLYNIDNNITNSNEPEPLIRPNKYGMYITSYQIGTPTVRTFAFVDTASSLTWLQCTPCQDCYPQNGVIFDPTKSSSYARLGCNDAFCQAIPKGASGCDSKSNTCLYDVRYVDQVSYTKGDYVTETLTFRSSKTSERVKFKNIPIGCGHDNRIGDENRPNIPGGILDFSRSVLGFPYRAGFYSFSYCLMPENEDPIREINKMSLGSAAKIKGGRTPLIKNKYRPDLYYVNLEGISVGNEKLPIPPGTFHLKENGHGGMIVDVGSPHTFLKSEAYYIMVNDIKKKTDITDTGSYPVLGKYHLCYFAKESDLMDSTPTLKFHFDGVDLEIRKENIWENVVSSGSFYLPMWCLAILPASYQRSVFGNFQQRNVNVGYSMTDEKVLSLEPTICKLIK